jgi:hypothetical protein
LAILADHDPATPLFLYHLRVIGTRTGILN